MASCPRLHSTTLLQAGRSSLPQRPLQAELLYFAAKKIRIGRGTLASTTFCRRAILLAGTMALQAELFYFAAKKIRIRLGTLASTTFRRRAVLLAASMVSQRFLISGPDLRIVAAKRSNLRQPVQRFLI